MKLYRFRAVPLPIIRRYYSVYTAFVICHVLIWLAASKVGVEKKSVVYTVMVWYVLDASV